MKELRTTARFERRLASFIKHHPEIAKSLDRVISSLCSQVPYANLKVHKLKGVLSDCYAARLGYSYRIVFLAEKESITLVDIGSHDEVYK